MINAPLCNSNDTKFPSPYLKSTKITEDTSSLHGSSKHMALAITDADSKATPVDKRIFYSIGTVEALN